MATLTKLAITGIRSFGPYEEHTQHVKFGSPVTLILGHNGCGKTTIIESLKYACSGDVPGGTSAGQGFVHDPKISKTSSTKGQIKLKLLDPRGNEITVARIVEVTQNEKTSKFSSKSSTIRKLTPGGEDTSIGGRFADVSAEVCQIMNVSPAVVNNVIFCHQENSLWPLDEGKKLKEKFDEIFDAAKYNRCAEEFRKHLKKKEADVKILDLQLAHNKDRKEAADKMTRNLHEKEDRLERYESDITTKNTELNSVKTRIDEILELEEQLADLDKQLTSKKATKNGVIEEQNTIKNSLKFEFEGSDEELREKISTFEKDRQKQEDSIVALETRMSDIDNKNRTVGDAIEEAQTTLGSYKGQKNQYDQKCSERTSLLENAIKELNITDAMKPYDDEATFASVAISALKSKLDGQHFNLSTLIEDEEKDETKLQSFIDKARDKTVTTKQNSSSKQNEMKECEKKVEEICCELMSLTGSDSLVDDMKKKVENIDRTAHSLKSQFDESVENKKIETYKKDIQTMENKLESLESEYKILQQNDVIEGKIESEKSLIMTKQKEINKMKLKHSDSLKQLFDGTIPEKNLKDSVALKQRNADTLVRSLRDEMMKKQKEVTTLEVQKKNQQEKVAHFEKEVMSNRSRISQACGGRDFNETLESTFQKKERLQIDKGQYNSDRIIYGQYINKFEEKSPCCPVCETDFSQKIDVVAKIISSLKTKLERVPQQLTKVAQDLEKEEALYNKLQQLKLVNEETEKLQKEKLPQLKQELNEIEKQLTTNMKDLDELKVKLSDPQKIVEISSRILSDVGSLDQNIIDVEKSQRMVANFKQNLVEVASKKSKQEIEAETDHIKFEISEYRGKVDQITKRKNDHKERIHQLMQERQSLVEQQIRLKEGLQSKPILETQKIELDRKINTLREEIGQLQVQLNLQQDELKNSIENKENAIRKHKKLIEEQRDQIKKYTGILQDIEKLQKEIDDYLKAEIDAKLKSTEEKLKELKNKESTLEMTKKNIIEAISKKKEALATEELRFRTLQSNVVLRDKKFQERRLETEIQDLKRRIGGFNYRTLHEEKVRLEQNRTKFEKDINNMLGEKNGLLETIEEIRRELNKPENKKSHSNYMAKLYELKLRMYIISDLKKYIVALEKAVLEFHKSKMIQINRTIRQFWRNTYRGNDIDHIEIRTEYATDSAKKRSYNYKVVQMKKGIELDMRGRCSAGQKVLACLLIRMALAETLSSNCGILALDEPTTNLDRANILSLSDTIAKIIQTRQQEKSFQLIVITHDEEFLNALTRVQGVDCYYRVERDKDGYSIVNKQETGH